MLDELIWQGNYFNEGMNVNNTSFDKLGEECGVFGVWGHPNTAQLCYYGLHALQHRGQESAGICTNDQGKFHYIRGMGLVKEVFNQDNLQTLPGAGAIAHVRYSTAGESKLANAQPLIFKYREGNVAIATNGNISNASEIKKQLEHTGSIFQTTSDTEVIAHLIAKSSHDDIVDAVKDALSQLVGAYALLIMTQNKLIAVSDPHGIRPFSMARIGDAYVFASESCAFDAVGADNLIDIQPGEMLVLDNENVLRKDYISAASSSVAPRHAICAMEYVYFARPDSDINSVNIHAARKRMGKQLALEAFVDADIVTGVPDSSISAAIGFSEQVGIPYELGLIKNRYTGRTFIQPSQELREQGVKMKLSAIRKVVEGKRVVMIDDSIVRGTTSLRIVNMLREAGATEVHVRISSPPFMNPCIYGIDAPTHKELIAYTHTVEEIRKKINADSLYFLSKKGMLDAINFKPETFNGGCCTACFDDMYPTEA